jgi:uncharacterized protein (DUF2237 family)
VIAAAERTAPQVHGAKGYPASKWMQVFTTHPRSSFPGLSREPMIATGSERGAASLCAAVTTEFKGSRDKPGNDEFGK